ncbi:hypothetical protein F3W81_16665 [Pseudooceanicola spongiae]|uniref:Uncharacterized protein n=1 Tax=Pseudooceanicola spongiae TaxID=2613965 RepID=A0A7L9WRH7_9RHOB|nr:hypothetical protein F3W81_16665 [Pseudooceanicola spongiae]
MSLELITDVFRKTSLVKIAQDHQFSAAVTRQEPQNILLDHREINLMSVRTAGKAQTKSVVVCLGAFGSVLIQCRAVGEVPAQKDRALGELLCMCLQGGCRNRDHVGHVHHICIGGCLGHEAGFELARKRVHIAVSGIGRNGKQRIVDVVEDRQAQAPCLVEMAGHIAVAAQAIECQMGGILHDIHAAWQIFIMGIGVFAACFGKDLGELFDPVFSALWQVEVADHRHLSPLMQKWRRGDLEGRQPGTFCPERLDVICRIEMAPWPDRCHARGYRRPMARARQSEP